MPKNVDPHAECRIEPGDLTLDELDLLIRALDSHEYWELSESSERANGYSTVEDGENPEIDAVRALVAKLGEVRRERGPQRGG